MACPRSGGQPCALGRGLRAMVGVSGCGVTVSSAHRAGDGRRGFLPSTLIHPCPHCRVLAHVARPFFARARLTARFRCPLPARPGLDRTGTLVRPAPGLSRLLSTTSRHSRTPLLAPCLPGSPLLRFPRSAARTPPSVPSRDSRSPPPPPSHAPRAASHSSQVLPPVHRLSGLPGPVASPTPPNLPLAASRPAPCASPLALPVPRAPPPPRPRPASHVFHAAHPPPSPCSASCAARVAPHRLCSCIRCLLARVL
ncbi:hypothetical protein BD626DRAFT_503368 [Schizophyllum amplum]|uniref:Uncharacterized protein n=1 Tax=Schizophyllum amplum TaxID=97359 RepID=A0A550C869_9AGAR|nr:hypothetical protein BD626DRAFT_503368 [Auriculariopsis ampla]